MVFFTEIKIIAPPGGVMRRNRSMFLNKRFVKAVIGIGLILLMITAALADTIRLKDGSIIKGRIVGFSGGKFTIAVGDGARRRELSFRADEVESINFNRDDERPAEIARNSEGGTVVINTPRTGGGRASNPRVVTTDTIRPTPSSTPRPIITPTPRPISTPTPRPVSTPVPRQVPTVSNRTPTPTSRQSPAVSPGKPVELTVRVLADNTANGWTNSGWVVRRGQKIKISGNGEVSLGRGRTSSAAGLYEIEDQEKLLPNVPTGALIAVIGDDNNAFIYIGLEREIIAERDGTLFLGINEGNLNDNTGAFEVKIEISTGS